MTNETFDFSVYTEDYIKQMIGRIAAAKRKAAGFSQFELADLANTNPKNLSTVETGKIYLSASLMSKLCSVYKCHPFEFFTFEKVCTPKAKDEKMHAVQSILSGMSEQKVSEVLCIVKALAEMSQKTAD